MKLLWTPQARRDRRTIFDYIRPENPMAAAAVDDQFAMAAGKLSRHPYSGRPGRVSGTRELLAHPSYLMIYDVQEGAVRILGIIHTARQWPPE
ncbi:type II toxin-antitoxin system RelE/ParE family toxin [Neorhizobium galegae]|uniref:Type II toxin-antitoxin system RelE/ParE family toxin n=1 Tax=Neorhizobium galegae TaxID=399 RepID=A0A6A1TW39_NEOGA|nr:type II toxin-antitoxin system RelE/ParE family toxin [Neorhizobium galegae]KAB1089091.1 type II toxin-antitoxin system RelE/ParE family toxin [Neorhizobium galegae]